MRATLLILCTAACSQPHGVAIEVDPGGTAAEQVELFIGRTACSPPDCNGIQPPGVNGVLPGDVFYRDGSATDTAPVVDGVATFQLVPDHGAETLPVVIAVGYKQTDHGLTPKGIAVVTDLAVSDEPQIIQATLGGATSHIVSLPAGPIPDGDRVEVWREKMSPNASCVVVQRWRAGMAEQVFVVPPDDPDCDDVPNGPLECDQDVFQASTAPTTLAEVTCVAQFPALNTPVCRLGGLGCTDGMGTVPCAPSPFCLPDIACGPVDGCKTPMPGCLEGRFLNMATPRLDCQIPTDVGQPCPGSDTATVDFGMVFALSMAQCTDISFYTGFSGGASLVFEPTLRFMSGVVIVASPPAAPCMFDVTFTSQSTVNLTTNDRGLIQLTIDNGEHIIIPVVAHYLPGCAGMSMTCTPFLGTSTTSGPDGVWSCLDF